MVDSFDLSGVITPVITAVVGGGLGTLLKFHFSEKIISERKKNGLNKVAMYNSFEEFMPTLVAETEQLRETTKEEMKAAYIKFLKSTHHPHMDIGSCEKVVKYKDMVRIGIAKRLIPMLCIAVFQGKSRVDIEQVTTALYSPIEDGWSDKNREYKHFKDYCTVEIKARLMPKIDRFFAAVVAKKHAIFGEVAGRGFKEEKLLSSWEKLYFTLGVNRMLEGL